MSEIWVNARFLSQPVTGVQRYAREICRALNESGHDVRLLAPPDASASEGGGRCKRIGRLTGHAWEQYELPRYLRGCGKPLLLNLCNTGPINYGRQIATLHDIAYLRFPDSFSWRFRTFYRTLVPALLTRALAVITVSEFSKREILARYGGLVRRIDVVPNAVSRDFAKSDSVRDDSSPNFLAVSSLTRQKNFQRLADAFALVAGELDATLRVVGSAHRSFAGTALDAGSQSERIVLLGRVSDDDLSRLYAQSTAFLFPSLYEGFGIPPLEAQACGCPVAAAKIEASKEVLGDSAVYFDPYDRRDIAARIWDLASSESLRDKLRCRGAANVGRFDWAASATKLRKIYEETANSSAA